MADIKSGDTIGPFTILETLPAGKGGMARVYQAKYTESHEEVALKVSRSDWGDPRFNNALKQEVDILKPLYHTGVVRLLPLPLAGAKQEVFMARVLELPDRPWFYAMEYLPGRSLHQLIKYMGPLPFPESCVIAALLVDALIYLQSHGVVHLDVKPENILFRYKPEIGVPIDPVLIDFGVAARTKSLTATGGSLHTMAPEQIRQTRGELPPEVSIDLKKMDIYSLGVVTYRMWTGTYPFEGITSQTLTSAVLNGVVQPPTEVNSQLPTQVDTFMLRWLAREPQSRPTLEDIRKYLDYWSAGLTHFSESFVKRPAKNRWMFWKK